MDNSGKVQGVDRVIMKGLFVVLLIWGSSFFSNTGGDPGFGVRHLGISLFCFSYVSYFILYSGYGYPSLTKWQILSLFSYFMFTLTGLMSSYLGVNPKEGVFPALINLNFIVLLLVTIHAFNNGLKLSEISFLIAIIGCFSGVFGVLQYYDFVPQSLITVSPPTALQFNRNFFGSSQVLILPFAFLSTFSFNGWRRVISLVSTLVILLSIPISQTRSAILALLVFGVFVLSVLSIRYLKGSLTRHRKVVLLISLVVFLGAGAFISENYFGNVERNIKSYFNGQENNNQSQSSVEERLTIWQGSTEIVKSNPYIGVGFGNWKIHYGAITDQPTRAKSGRVVISKAHNVYLEILCETGIIGLLFYCLFLVIIIYLIRKHSLNNFSALFLGAGFLAFLTDYLFSFGNYQPSHMIYVGLMSGYLLSLSKSVEPKQLSQRITVPAGSITAVLSLFAIYWAFSLILFEHSISKGQTNSSSGDFHMALYHFENAIDNVHSLNRQGDSPHLQKAFVYNKMKKFDDAIKELHLAWKVNPYSSRVNATFGTSYFAKQDLEMAALYYQNAYDVQSRNMAIVKKLAICYFEMKEFEKCVKLLDSFTAKLNPNLKLMLKVSRMNTGQNIIPNK